MDLATAVKGSVILLGMVLAPGYALCWALYPRRESLGVLERFGLSLLLGLTPQFILYALDKNLGVPINSLTVAASIAFVTVAGYLTWKARVSE